MDVVVGLGDGAPDVVAHLCLGLADLLRAHFDRVERPAVDLQRERPEGLVAVLAHALQDVFHAGAHRRIGGSGAPAQRRPLFPLGIDVGLHHG